MFPKWQEKYLRFWLAAKVSLGGEDTVGESEAAHLRDKEQNQIYYRILESRLRRLLQVKLTGVR